MPASSSTALGGIADLSLERRCAFVLTAGGAELDATMRWLHRTAPDVQKAMSPERLAWAVASDVGQRATGSAPVSKGKRARRDRRSLARTPMSLRAHRWRRGAR